MPPNSSTVLVTGGAGFIGCHTVVEVVNAGYDVVVLDNLSNCNKTSLLCAGKLVGRHIPLTVIDLRDEAALSKLFDECNITAVVHFAALKSVEESVRKPLLYYENNIGGMLNLLKVMSAHNVKKLVYSSSCTVYGSAITLPLREDAPSGECLNSYGFSKYVGEVMLKDLYLSDPSWQIICLRYFNPIGAHPSGMIGEDPQGVPANLMPYVSQVAAGRRPVVNVFGDCYPTPDGTGVRDYLHVMDCAQAHVAALKKLESINGLKAYNIGTGKGYSVIEIIKAMEKACGKAIPYKICPPRAGDSAEVYADCTLVKKELGWVAQYNIEDMCRDQWNWQTKNPNGFASDQSAGDV